MQKMKLLGPANTRTFRCIWMLEELGIPYQRVPHAKPVSRTAKKFNASGKIPVLLEYDCGRGDENVDNDDDDEEPSFVLTESVAINTYLGDMCGRSAGFSSTNESLVPKAGSRERAAYDEAVCCILSELDAQGLWIGRKHDVLGEYFGTIPEAVTAAQKHFTRMNRHVVDSILIKHGGPYLLGKHFTAADILYVQCLDWSKSMKWHENWPERVEDYLNLCHQRPAYQRTKAMEADEVQKEKEQGREEKHDPGSK